MPLKMGDIHDRVGILKKFYYFRGLDELAVKNDFGHISRLPLIRNDYLS